MLVSATRKQILFLVSKLSISERTFCDMPTNKRKGDFGAYSSYIMTSLVDMLLIMPT